MSYSAAIRHLTASLVLVSMLSGVAAACPFCSAVAKTFSEEIDTVDVAVFAKLTEAPKKAPEQDDNAPYDLAAPTAKAKFEVVQILKGENHVKAGSQIEVLYFGDRPVGSHFLVLGVEPPVLTWATPIETSDRAREYINLVMKLPKEGADRLAFFLTYLEDKEEMLTRDAYDEFAKAPYADVKAIKDRIDHDQLVAWLWNPQVPASRKRLYMTLLGVCGGENDLLMLETILKSDVREVKAGLDATIACYLTLKGPEGMPLVEEMFLKNKEAEYTDTYAAIMALRFHGQENQIIPKERIKLA
ncbi:MAG: hypothetical protein IAG10_03880, partial [Planctomycetaceae bacterium]|nr:hypothetical protein [Planctomycetaceae bacterium]